jgi:hypothetical protein
MNEFVNIAALILVFFVGFAIGCVIGSKKSKRWYNWLISQYQNHLEIRIERYQQLLALFFEATDYLDFQTTVDLFLKLNKIIDGKRENEK